MFLGARSRLSVLQRTPTTLPPGAPEATCHEPTPRERDRLPPPHQRKYAFATYCCTMRCVLKNDPLRAMAWRITSTNLSRSL